MGFGTLFIGYFFLVNISYFAYTDIIAAMVMLMGLYKLSSLNRPFKTATVFAAVFALYSLLELVISVMEIFLPSVISEATVSYITIPRYILLLAMTCTILLGVRDVAGEVGADELSRRAASCLPLSFIYPLCAIFELPAIGELLGKVAVYIYFVLILASVAYVAVNLVTLWRAYAQICMPEDLEPKVKKSRFEFVNKYREKEEERNREYTEYKAELQKRHAAKKAAKKNKKGSEQKK